MKLLVICPAEVLVKSSEHPWWSIITPHSKAMLIGLVTKDELSWYCTYFQCFLSFMFVFVCLSFYLDCFIDISCTFRPFIVKFDISFYCYSIVKFCCCLTTLLLIYSFHSVPYLQVWQGIYPYYIVQVIYLLFI